MSRQPKCIPIVATQSVSSLKEALPNEVLLRWMLELASIASCIWPGKAVNVAFGRFWSVLSPNFELEGALVVQFVLGSSCDFSS